MIKTRHFTLLEMMIVLAVLSVIAGTGAVVHGQIHDAKVRKTRNNLRTIVEAIDIYKKKTNSNPASVADLVSEGILHRAPDHEFGGSYTITTVPLVGNKEQTRVTTTVPEYRTSNMLLLLDETSVSGSTTTMASTSIPYSHKEEYLQIHKYGNGAYLNTESPFGTPTTDPFTDYGWDPADNATPSWPYDVSPYAAANP